MREKQVDELIVAVRERLMAKRPADGGIWQGHLSSSAISTSVSVFALYMADKDLYSEYIKKGTAWLHATMKSDGSWGDSVESPANLTATLLTYASLYAVGAAPQQTQALLTQKFGGSSDEHIINGVLSYYGKDLTFSVPILVMCALSGIIASWDKIPQLPFELAILPQRFFRFLRLPVVSYAIPALIAVGILLYKKKITYRNSKISNRENKISDEDNKLPKRVLSRSIFIGKSLSVLEKLQPPHGGFLEAAPLTAFVTMCMCAAGYRQHVTVVRATQFLSDTIRNGSWPIDTNLSCWVTSLSVRALGDDLPDKSLLATKIKQNAFRCRHPYTGAKAGGWGWTDLPGSVPDADDTAGALVALHGLLDGVYCTEVGKGIEWLLDLQNGDGGMPTFCKGWGKLPFDRSSADISAHTLLAFRLWMNAIPADLRKKCQASMARMYRWMRRNQHVDGSWTPLWFGDQDASDERSPVYGTATTTEYLAGAADVQDMVSKGLNYLMKAQNKDGGWGGAKGVTSKVTLTARALGALASYPDADEAVTARAFDYLARMYQAEELFRPEPIGLYFSRLWYSEELYNLTFVLSALKKYKNILNKQCL
jgi:squalene-hopene/tetraprenyl-beta-curcumene cyclase